MNFNKILFFTVAQGKDYELMALNLCKSIKKYNKRAVIATVSREPVSFSDIHLDIKEICKNTNDINELLIRNQAYSWKMGVTKFLPKEFKKYVFLDCDSECFSAMDVNDPAIQNKFYSAWCQSIITANKEVMNKIDKNNWSWHGSTFEGLIAFAKKFNIKEWKNINAGMFTIHSSHVDRYIERYYYWADRLSCFFPEYYKIYNFDKKLAWGTEEITFSLLQAEEDPMYKSLDICRNRIAQLCMNFSADYVRKNKSFDYSAWFSTRKSSTNVRATTVHFPNGKKELIEQATKIE